MRNVLFFICLMSISFYSCKKSGKKDQAYVGTVDTIHTANYPSEINDKLELLNVYNLRFGIAIPKYYVIKDSLSIDLNGDNLIDTLVLLSPILIEDTKYSEFSGTDTPKRVLVEVLNIDGLNSKIRNLHYKLVSDIPGTLSKYSGMYITKDGFEIRHEAGSRYSWDYTCEFSNKYHDDIYLVRIKKICSLEGNDLEREYSFNKESVERINVIDTIKNNCNCDPLWKMLEDNG